MARRNAFLALSELAMLERWCWNLSCGTCGHGEFRWSLRALAAGDHPDDPNRSLRRGLTFTEISEIHGPRPPSRGWPLHEQRLLQAIVADVKLVRLASGWFPDWLGHLGVALAYTEEAESGDALITRNLGHQLLVMVDDYSSAAL